MTDKSKKKRMTADSKTKLEKIFKLVGQLSELYHEAVTSYANSMGSNWNYNEFVLKTIAIAILHKKCSDNFNNRIVESDNFNNSIVEFKNTLSSSEKESIVTEYWYSLTPDLLFPQQSHDDEWYSYIQLANKFLDKITEYYKKPLDFENAKLAEEENIAHSNHFNLLVDRLIWVLNQYDLSDENISEPDYLLLWDFLITVIGKTRSQTNNANAYHELITPYFIKRLVTKIIDPEPFETVCNPYMGFGGFLFQIYNETYRKHESSINNITDDFQKIESRWNVSKEDSPSFISTMKGVGFERNHSLYNLLSIILIPIRVGKLSIQAGDFSSYCENSDKKYDVIVSQPPYGLRATGPRLVSLDEYYTDVNVSDTFYQLFVCLKQLRPKGRIAFLLLQSELAGNKNQKFRQYLIERDLVEAVIEISPNEYPHLNNRLKLGILILNNQKKAEDKNKIQFINAKDIVSWGRASNLTVERFKKIETSIDKIKRVYTGEESDRERKRTVSKEEIQENNFILVPKQYFFDKLDQELKVLQSQDKIKVSPLGAIAYMLPGRINRTQREASIESSQDDLKVPYIQPRHLSKEINHRYINLDEKSTSYKMVPIDDVAFIRRKAIFISRHGDLRPTIYDPGYSQKDKTENSKRYHYGVAISPGVIAIYPKNDAFDIDYLYFQLYSSLIQRQIEKATAGFVMISTSPRTLNGLIIPTLGGIEEQHLYVEQQKRLLLEKENARHEAFLQSIELKKAGEDSAHKKRIAEFQMIRHLAHDLKPKISTIRTFLETLEPFLENEGLLLKPIQEPLDEDDIVDTVAVSLEKALNNTIQMTRVLGSVRELVIQEFKEEDFTNTNFKTFFEKEVERLNKEATNYKIDTWFQTKTGKWKIKLHKKAFSVAIDNIITNAEKHGFKSSKKIYQINFSIFETQNDIIIEYINNGEPLPENLNEQDFLTFGKKSKMSTGEGLGGAWINKSIEAHKGSFEIFRDEHPVHFKITLPKERG